MVVGASIVGGLPIAWALTEAGVLEQIDERVMLTGLGGRCGNDVGDAGIESRRKADISVGAERTGDLLAEVSAEALAGDTANDFTDQPAESDRMIAMPGAGLPPWLLAGKFGGDLLPTKDVVELEGGANRGHPGLVTEQIFDGDITLAGGGELGPILGDGGLEIELALVGEAMGTEGAEALGGGPYVDERVAIPGLGAGGVGVTTPEVNDRLAVEGDGYGGADLAALGEVFGEDLADARKAGIAISLNGNV